MEIYKIEIQEFLARVVEIKANSSDDAISRLKKRYLNEELVLNYNDFVNVDFIDINLNSENDEKKNLIDEVINYLINDEKKHFEEYEKEPENHIYKKLLRLKKLL